jgi:hypothetical protein
VKRITIMIVMLGTLMVTTMPVLADEPKGGGANAKVGGMPLQWKATSPSTHEGDRYDLTMTNTGDEAQEARVRTFIMDHRNHTNMDVVDEQVELEPGETREFAALNDYGEANHFNTFVGSETRDLELAVAVTDAEGAETARFTDAAFTVQEKGSAGAKGKGKDKGKDKAADGHVHDEGFAALGDTARLAPLSLGLLATTGLGLYTFRRRRAWAVAGGERAGLAPSSPVWRVMAVVGLALSAALHVGLVPAHWGEAAIPGLFFCIVGALSAVVAATILVWPSRLAYLAGAAISLALIILWAVFLVVPPPGAEAAETVDLIGLITKATELIALIACTALWSRASHDHQPDQEKFQMEVG